MQIVTVEIDNPDGLHLLEDLEKLNVLRIVKDNIIVRNTKLSDKYRGVFSKEDAVRFSQHTKTLRKEWDNT